MRVLYGGGGAGLDDCTRKWHCGLFDIGDLTKYLLFSPSSNIFHAFLLIISIFVVSFENILLQAVIFREAPTPSE